MEIKFKRNFKLVDNGDLTQNLHSLCYQNNILISETNLGNIEDIVVQLKKQKEINKKAIEYINQHWVVDDPIGFKNDLLEMLEDKEV